MAKFVDLTRLGYFKTKLQALLDGIFLKKTEYTAPSIQVIKLNGSPLSPDGSKAINIDLSNYALSSSVTQEIAEAVSGITGFDAQVVSSLPGSGKKGILYLVANSGSGNNVYDEYLWINSKFEKLGTRDINLSGYALKTEIPTAVSDLENDTGFQTASQVNSAITSKGYQTASQVQSAIESATSDFITSADLPTAITEEEIDGLFS